jgi:hypothetical protein
MSVIPFPLRRLMNTRPRLAPPAAGLILAIDDAIIGT